MNLENGIRKYCDRGWPVFPVVGKKYPTIKNWGENATADLATIKGSEWFETGDNIAIVTGNRSGLVVIDFDKKDKKESVEELIDRASKEYGELPETYTVKSGNGGRHLYYAVSEEIEIRNKARFGDLPIDVRGEGGYVIAPPSVHPETEENYEIVKDIPLATLPESWINTLRQTESGSDVRGENMEMPKTGYEIWDEGERNERLYRHLCGRINSVTSTEQLRNEAFNANKTRCRPSLPEEEVEQIVASVQKYSASNDSDPFDFKTVGEISTSEIEKLFENFVIVAEGGKPFVVDLENFSFSSFRNAQEMFNHRYVTITTTNGPRQKNAMKYWQEHTSKRYRKLVYKPSGKVTSDEINLWRGFSVQPNPEGNCDIFFQHIYENIGEGSQEQAEFLLDWMAQLIQHPERRLGIVPVLRGDQGVGKSIIGQVLGKLYHEDHFLNINNIEALTRRFNVDLAKAQFILADEAIWGGNRSIQSQLKGLLTEPRMTIEPKGVNQYQVDAFFRVMMTSNEDWAAPVERKDRRYVAISVGDTRRNDRKFFDAMMEQLNREDGYGRLLYELQNRDISMRDWGNLPIDSAHIDMLIRGFDQIEAWIYDSLCAVPYQDGRQEEDPDDVQSKWFGLEPGESEASLLLNRSDIDRASIPKQKAYERFREYYSNSNSKSLPSQQVFGRKLKSVLRLSSSRETSGEHRATLYQFDSVADLKAAFADHVGISVEHLFER